MKHVNINYGYTTKADEKPHTMHSALFCYCPCKCCNSINSFTNLDRKWFNFITIAIKNIA